MQDAVVAGSKVTLSKGTNMKTNAILVTVALAFTLGGAPAVADEGGSPPNGFLDIWSRSDPGACARGQAQLDRNTRTAIAYYTLAFNAGEPELAVRKYVGVDANGQKTYTQHNPFAEDGPQAFINFVNFFKGIFPDLHVRIVRTIAQCDLVMTHAHITTSATDLGNAAMDIFRFDRHGKIVEHWDAVQPVEADSANDNTQF
jgi:predicted SnoaL-like aldol condensation-catalyzing enzyme